MDFILFILSTAGLTWGLTRSKLFKSYREKLSKKRDFYSRVESSQTIHSMVFGSYYWLMDSLFGCYGCMGFWSGIFCYYLVFVNPITFLIYGLVGASVSLLIIDLIVFLERR